MARSGSTAFAADSGNAAERQTGPRTPIASASVASVFLAESATGRFHHEPGCVVGHGQPNHTNCIALTLSVVPRDAASKVRTLFFFQTNNGL